MEIKHNSLKLMLIKISVYHIGSHHRKDLVSEMKSQVRLQVDAICHARAKVRQGNIAPV